MLKVKVGSSAMCGSEEAAPKEGLEAAFPGHKVMLAVYRDGRRMNGNVILKLQIIIRPHIPPSAACWRWGTDCLLSQSTVSTCPYHNELLFY